MKREMLSFVVASAVIVGVFVVNYAIKGDDGQAYAAAGSQMSREIRDGARISAARLRDIRQSVSANPENILDVSGRELMAVLDAPELVRTDKPTTIWQYRNAFCVLDIYFTTQDKTALRAPAVHYEVRARGKDTPDSAVQNRCVRDLVRAHAGVNLVKVSQFYKAE